MRFSRLKEKFKLWKIKRQYTVNGRFPVSLDFYKCLITEFGSAPIDELDKYIEYITSDRITLYTKDIMELKSLLNVLYTSIIERKGFNSNQRLSAGKLEDVETKYFRTYLSITETNNIGKQKKAILDCMELTLSCIQIVEDSKKKDQPLGNYYSERVLLLTTDFADIYYALIVFYIGK